MLGFNLFHNEEQNNKLCYHTFELDALVLKFQELVAGLLIEPQTTLSACIVYT